MVGGLSKEEFPSPPEGLRSTYVAVVSKLFADLQLEKAIILPYSWSSKRLPVFQGEVVEYQQLTEIKGIFAV